MTRYSMGRSAAEAARERDKKLTVATHLRESTRAELMRLALVQNTTMGKMVREIVEAFMVLLSRHQGDFKAALNDLLVHASHVEPKGVDPFGPVERRLHVHHETAKAILVTRKGGSRSEGVWLAKSTIAIDGDCEPGVNVDITIPRHIAQEKGLI